VKPVVASYDAKPEPRAHFGLPHECRKPLSMRYGQQLMQSEHGAGAHHVGSDDLISCRPVAKRKIKKAGLAELDVSMLRGIGVFSRSEIEPVLILRVFESQPRKLQDSQ
jgi:hypothetical protein